MAKVLVTGGAGFVASHCLAGLLRAGHEVRATVRDLKKEGAIRAALLEAGTDPGSRLSLFRADLGEDSGWREAVRDCEYILHVASPFPEAEPKDENELIIPAREGALRVLRAARDAGARRVVMTSSFAAIGYGHPPRERAFDETSWTEVESPGLPAYHKSKTLAERAAWDFIAREGGKLELSVVNPVGIFGPLLGGELCSSIKIVKMMLEGKMPVCPRIYFGVVDVRDVADLHLRAMVHPQAPGERFIAVSGPALSLFQVGRMLRKCLGTAASRTPKAQLPDWSVRLLARFDRKMSGVTPELGKIKHATSEKAQRLLDWNPRSAEEAIRATGESLIARKQIA